MEIITSENILTIGNDLTPPLLPLAFSLHDSFLHTHCSSCFSPLPTPTPTPTPIPHYCSTRCSTSYSNLHHSSASHHLLSNVHPYGDDTSDLRTALLLIHYFKQNNDVVSDNKRHFQLNCHDNDVISADVNKLNHLNENDDDVVKISNAVVERSGDGDVLSGEGGLIMSRVCGMMENVEKCTRVHGLMTNRENLVEFDYEEDGLLLRRIKDGARAMAKARRMRDGLELGCEFDCDEEEKVLCVVLTNAVEVQDSTSGVNLGIAVYDKAFSWINHSCSPNACYHFVYPRSKDEEIGSGEQC